MELAARYAYRITFRPYQWDVTRDVVTRHRRLGVGITGITDWFLLAFGDRAVKGAKDSEKMIFNPKVVTALNDLYGHVRAANLAQAQELEASASIKVTTVKPSGTVSILMGVSPGQHFHWAPYMIRRVRISTQSALVDALMACGYHVEPAVKGYDPEGNIQYDLSTAVVSFPIKAPTAEHPRFQSAGDVSLREQAAIQALLATHWADNAVSATLSFHKAKPSPVYFKDGGLLLDKFGQPELRVNPAHEQHIVKEITELLDNYKEIIKSTTLLPYATDTYPQMPYEAISQETYEEMLDKITGKPWDILNGVVKADEYDVLDTSTECVGGVCPLR